MVLTPRHQGGHHGGGFGSSGADVGGGGASAGSSEHGSESEVMVVTGGTHHGASTHRRSSPRTSPRGFGGGQWGNGAQTLNTAGMASGLGGMSGDRSRKPPLYAYARNRPSRGWWGGNTSPKLARRDARGRAGRRRVSRLRWMFIALTLWMYGPFIHKIIGGFNKVYMRRWFHPIERPYPCEATALAPKNLVDNSPISNLLPPDMTNLPGLRPQHLKVGIITLCDAGVEAICAESTANKQAYADLHGYDLIVDEDIVDKSRPASWSKLLAMRKYLPNYDFVLYIDIDTIIMNPDRRLEDIVDFNYDQMLAADKNGLNCGVWMLRNTPWTLWFIDEMWAQDQLVAPKTWNMLFKYEQRAFHFLYQSTIWRSVVKGEAYPKANTVRARTKALNACVFNSQPAFYVNGDLLVHLAGLKGTVKCMWFRYYYKIARLKMHSKGPVSADADLPPPSLWTCMTRNT